MMGWLDPDYIWETARLERLTGDIFSGDWPDTFRIVPPPRVPAAHRSAIHGGELAESHAPGPRVLSSRGSGRVHPTIGRTRPASLRNGS